MITGAKSNLRSLYTRFNCAATDLAYLAIWAATWPVVVYYWGSDIPTGIAISVTFVFPLAMAMVSGGLSRRTVGMRSADLGFGDYAGNPISAARCALRILAGFLLMPLFPISAGMMAADPLRRSLADRMLQTAMKEQRDAVSNRTTVFAVCLVGCQMGVLLGNAWVFSKFSRHFAICGGLAATAPCFTSRALHYLLPRVKCEADESEKSNAIKTRNLITAIQCGAVFTVINLLVLVSRYFRN